MNSYSPKHLKEGQHEAQASISDNSPQRPKEEKALVSARQTPAAWAKEHPVAAGFVLVLLFVVFRKGLYFLFRALPQNTGLRVVHEVLDVIWPYLLVVLFGQTWTYKAKGFFRTLYIALPLLIASAALLVVSIVGTAEQGVEWYPFGMILLGVFTGFAIGFREESVFRAISLNVLAAKYLKDRRGVWIAVLGSAFFFALVHMSNMMTGSSFVSCLAQTVNAFFAGAMFGAFYLRGGSLWAMIFLHGLYDIAVSVTNLFTKTYGADMLTALAENRESSFLTVLTSNPLSLGFIAITLFLLRKSKCGEIIERYQ